MIWVKLLGYRYTLAVIAATAYAIALSKVAL